MASEHAVIIEKSLRIPADSLTFERLALRSVLALAVLFGGAAVGQGATLAERAAAIDAPDPGRELKLAVPLEIGRAEITPAAGTRVGVLLAHGTPCGLVIGGPARLRYRVEDRFSAPVAERNVRRASSLSPRRTDLGLDIMTDLSGAVVWGWGLGQEGTTAATTGPALPEWATKLFAVRRFPSPSHDLHRRGGEWARRACAMRCCAAGARTCSSASIRKPLRRTSIRWRARGEVFDSRTRWLDVGGGDGTVAETLLRADPQLSCDVFNLPPVAGLVEERARAAGLADRLGFVGGDFLNRPLPGGYDVLSFVRVLHDWPADVARALLEKAWHALPPGGRIAVCEEFRTRDRLAVQFFWTYFLVGVDACKSRLREVTWYTEALAALGFADIRVIPGPFDVVVATRA